IDTHNALVKKWNKFIPEYNAVVSPRNVGRPLQASPAQVTEVKRLHKAGGSIRSIEKATGLTFRTVRTIPSAAPVRSAARQISFFASITTSSALPISEQRTVAAIS